MTAALVQFAAAQFALSKPYKKTGKTRLTILLDIQKQTGITARELTDLPPLPRYMEYLWEWFLKLHDRRQMGMAQNPISWSDQKACFELLKLHPSLWELDVISQLDNAFMASLSNDYVGVASSAKAVGAFLPNKKDGEK